MGIRIFMRCLCLLVLLLCAPVSAFAATEVTSDITADTHWTLAGSPYVVHFDNNQYFPHLLMVSAGATLTIDPGVVVKFGAYNGITVRGTLRAEGTTDNPIVFTSLQDDSAGGDTNDDGTATEPTDEQWMHLEFWNGSVGTFDHADVRYGGAHRVAVVNTGIENIGGTVTIDHTTLTHNGYDGFGQQGGYSTIQNSLISDQQVGINMSGGELEISDTRIYNNTASGIRHSWEGTLSITRSEIDHNGVGVVSEHHGSISITGSSIHDNPTAIDNESEIIGYDDGDTPYVSDPGITIDARNNWWGSASSPQPLTYGAIDYAPWLTTDPFAPPDPCASGGCASNVLFLPCTEGSRLYRPNYNGGADKLWEPNTDTDVQDLYMNADGTSARFDVYTKEGDILNELPSGTNIYKSFIAKMNDLKTSGTINDWEPIAYDWRLSLDDILTYGNDVGGRVYYSGDLRATSTPYLIQELKRLASTSQTGKVTIIAHSNGGLLAKRLTELLGPTETARLIDKIIFVAVPQAGTPMAIPAGLHGYKQDLLFGLITSKETARTFASNSPMEYNLLPSASYFTQIDDPVVTFDPSLPSWIARYGSTTHSQERLHQFLVDSFGRVDSQHGDANAPIQFNDSLLSNAETLHTSLDAWEPPSGVSVVQIAGWGVPSTVTGITYKKNGAGVETEPNFTIDGDGTVVVPSALWTSTTTGATDYWMNLRSFNADHPIQSGFGLATFDHSRILEPTEVLKFLSDQITNTTNPLSDYKYLSTQAPPAGALRLRYSLHSPLTLNLYDDVGRHTGVSTSTGEIEEQIPGTYYAEFGEVKYLFTDASDPAHIMMNGYASGTFTLNIDQYSGDTLVASTTFKDIPTTASTTVSLYILSDISTLSSMRVDEQSDGGSVITLAPRLGSEVTYEPVPISEPAPLPKPQASSRGGGGGSISIPIVVKASIVATTTALAITQTIATSTIKVVTASKEKKEVAIATTQKKASTTPQTASVYQASQQPALSRLGGAVYNGLYGFWTALKKIF